MDLVNPGRRQTRNVEHLEEPFRRGLTQLLQIARLTSLDEIADDGQRRRPQAAHATQLARMVQWREVVGTEREQPLRGTRVRLALERVLAFELEIRRNPRENVRRRSRI